MYYVKFLILILCALALMNKSYGTSQNKKGYSKLPKLTSNTSIREPLLAKGTKMNSTAEQKLQKPDINIKSTIAKKMGKRTTSSSENAKLILLETNSRSTAHQIYQAYGVDKSMKLCKSIDGRSSIIYGYGICKEAAERLNLASQDDYIVTKCVWVPMNEKSYKHLSVTQSVLTPSLLMVECKKYNKLSILFRLAHAKDHFYYRFDIKEKKPEIKSILKIDPPKDNYYPYYPKIIPTIKNKQIISDRGMTDNIFVHIGYASSNRKDHVCKKLANGSLEGQELCEKMLSEKVIRGKANSTKPLVCMTKKFLRFKPGDNSFGWPEYSEEILMAKCEYFHLDKYYTAYFFNAVLDDYYFVAEPKYQEIAIHGKEMVINSDLELTKVCKIKLDD